MERQPHIVRVRLKEDSIVNEMDMISTILLPPEDAIPDHMQTVNALQNPYFIMKDNSDWHQYHFASMLNNYQQVTGNQYHRLMADREMLSSQYSSVASTIAPERPRMKESSPSLTSLSKANRNFSIKNGVGKRAIKVPAKLRNFFGTSTN